MQRTILQFLCLIFRRVVKAKIGRVSTRLLNTGLLANSTELALPDSFHFLFAYVFCFRADAKPTEDLVWPDAFREGYAAVRLGIGEAFRTPTGE